MLNTWDQKDVKLTKVKKSNKNFDWSTYDPKVNKKINVIETKMPTKTQITHNGNKNVDHSIKEELTNSSNNKNMITSKPPRNPDPNTNRASIISTSGIKPETIQDKQEKKNISKLESTKQSNSSENLRAINTNQIVNSNLRVSSGDQQSIELLQVENSSSVFSNTFSKHIPGRNTFAPNQINKIYPMRSTSFTSEKNSPKKSLSPVDDNHLSSQLITKDSSENYLKQETYPKFPQQQQQQKNTIGDNNSNSKSIEESESITSSEIRFKQRTSPDGIESVKRKENDDDS